MRGATYLARLRRRPVVPALILSYVLLFQAILGQAAGTAHAFAMAQQDALGLAMLCVEDGTDGRRIAEPGSREQQAPANDCLNCGIACGAGLSGPALPQPDLVPLYLIAWQETHSCIPRGDEVLPRAALFASDLPARAPPAMA